MNKFKALKTFFLNNIGLKIISVMLAILLWLVARINL
jgi:YbbR domain-containing protein